MFPSAAEEAAVVETPSLRCVQGFEVWKRMQVFNLNFVSIQFTTLSRFNALGRAANSQIHLACNLKVFRMV